MPERQKHGFDYENYIIEKYNLRKEYSYTDKWDCYGIDDTPIQIKFIKQKSSIDLGDLVRNSKIDNDFILHVGFWNVDKTPENVYKNVTLYVKKDIWKTLFVFDKYKEMKEKMKEITNDIKDDKKSKEYITIYKKLWEKTNNIISIRFKRDHDKQMRWQCSISYKMFNEFIKLFLEIDLEKYRHLEPFYELTEITKSNKNLDKYYTKHDIVEKCLLELNSFFNINKFDVVIEPSAGSGNFLKGLAKYIKNNKIKSYDIQPECSNILKVDYLDLKPKDIIGNEKKNVLVVGNPPFGRQCSNAIKFFNNSAEFANVIAFIMPKSFKKQSMQEKLHKNFYLKHMIDLEDESFYYNKKIFSIPCVFQIWFKKEEIRPLPIKEIPVNDYYFIKDPNSINYKDKKIISIRRVGINASKAEIYNNQNKQSHYFIIIKNNNIITRIIDYLNIIKWEHNNTLGPRSISKTEFIKVINLFYQNEIYDKAEYTNDNLYIVIPYLLNYINFKKNILIDYFLLYKILNFIPNFEDKYKNLKCMITNKSKNKKCIFHAKYIFNNKLCCGTHSKNEKRIILPSPNLS